MPCRYEFHPKRGRGQEYTRVCVQLVSSQVHTHQRRERSGAPSSNPWTVPQNEERPIKQQNDYIIESERDLADIGASLRMKLVGLLNKDYS